MEEREVDSKLTSVSEDEVNSGLKFSGAAIAFCVLIRSMNITKLDNSIRQILDDLCSKELQQFLELSDIVNDNIIGFAKVKIFCLLLSTEVYSGLFKTAMVLIIF